MTQIKIYCDHCGKELNSMSDYEGIDVGILILETVDLCHVCFETLEKRINEFCNIKVKECVKQ